MRKTLAIILSLLMSSAVYAADNAVTVTNGADVNLKSKDLGAGLQLMQHGILDTAGNEILGLLTASPAATSISGRLVTINTTLGSPFQAGGSIGNAFALANQFPTSLTASGADGVSNTLNGTQTYSRLQMFNGTTWDRLIGDTTSGIWVNIKAGAGSGGTALADGATFTQGTTSLTPIGCLFINSYTAITTGKAGVLSCTNAGSLHTTVDNTNANGQATMANSSPVAVAKNSGTGSTIAGAAVGTAGTAAAEVVTIQGIASMTKLLVTPDSVALPANQSVNVSQVNGVTILTGTGATGTGAPRVTVSTDQATNAGAALVKGGVGVVNGGSTYQAVAASQTATVLQISTGATGDYLSHCVLYPTSTSPGVVTVFDNTNAAAGSAILFPGGATSLSNLAPISIPVGALSTAGAWKVTTGASISVVCYGKFS